MKNFSSKVVALGLALGAPAVLLAVGSTLQTATLADRVSASYSTMADGSSVNLVTAPILSVERP